MARRARVTKDRLLGLTDELAIECIRESRGLDRDGNPLPDIAEDDKVPRTAERARALEAKLQTLGRVTSYLGVKNRIDPEDEESQIGSFTESLRRAGRGRRAAAEDAEAEAGGDPDGRGAGGAAPGAAEPGATGPAPEPADPAPAPANGHAEPAGRLVDGS